ncbi:MAG: GMC oxidoreductase, partial [Gammaproteobacteria bacterium]
MADLTIVGSGASGVHFALRALERGHSVEMIDVGWTPDASVPPEASFADLKETLADPADYFLGRNFEGVVLPGNLREPYATSPSKAYVFRPVPYLNLDTSNFFPSSSFARGGLAEAWNGGCYPLNDHELEDFPFSYSEIEPFYCEVAKRIGISGAKDELASSIPFHSGIQEALKLDRHSELLLSLYRGKRRTFQNKLGCRIGRTRQAVLTRDQGGRRACDYLGRCAWGCPRNALYTPSATLLECLNHPNFTYLNQHYVRYFRYDDSRRIETLVLQSLDGRICPEIPVKSLVLAAGTLGSSRILLESVFRASGEVIRLAGLMDNRRLTIPYVNLLMAGKAYEAKSHQFSQLAMGFDATQPKEYIHCPITTLKTAMIHRLVDQFPFDLKTSLYLFRNLHASFGQVDVYFPDIRREENYLTLDPTGDSEYPRLKIHYTPPENEPQKLADARKRITNALFRLGCFAPPWMVRVCPPGSSAQYAGTIPMTRNPEPKWSTDPDCRSNDFKNLYIIDGSTFPFLPA